MLSWDHCVSPVRDTSRLPRAPKRRHSCATSPPVLAVKQPALPAAPPSPLVPLAMCRPGYLVGIELCSAPGVALLLVCSTPVAQASSVIAALARAIALRYERRVQSVLAVMGSGLFPSQGYPAVSAYILPG